MALKYTTTFDKADMEKATQFLSPLDPLAKRLKAEYRQARDLEEAILTREKLLRDVRIFEQENGGLIVHLPPQKFRSHPKHHGVKTKAERKLASAKSKVNKLSDDDKLDLIRKLQESLK